MIIAHKIALDPNAAQRQYFARACGTARFAYNWALAEWQRQYKAGGKPSEAALRRQLNKIKRDQYPWMLDVTKTAVQQAIKNLGAAFNRFFTGKSKYPKFKKRGINDSFRADDGPGTFKVSGKRIRLSKIGWIKMHEALRFSGEIMSATVSRVADRWFVSITVRIGHQVPIRENQSARGRWSDVCGVDLGVKSLATLSDGSTYDGPKALRYYLAKLKRLSRSLSRKVKGSANRRKAAARIARLHAKITNIRKDTLHKLTTDLVSRYVVIGIEDLNVSGMMKNRKLSRAVADVGMYEFRRQLEYKAAMRGSTVVVVDRWYPSSKTCSGCGHVVEKLPLSVREWSCPACGSVHDRDHNAAINLKKAASSAVSACGAEGSGRQPVLKVKPAATKQELNDVLLGHA